MPPCRDELGWTASQHQRWRMGACCRSCTAWQCCYRFVHNSCDNEHYLARIDDGPGSSERINSGHDVYQTDHLNLFVAMHATFVQRKTCSSADSSPISALRLLLRPECGKAQDAAAESFPPKRSVRQGVSKPATLLQSYLAGGKVRDNAVIVSILVRSLLPGASVVALRFIPNGLLRLLFVKASSAFLVICLKTITAC